MVNALGRPFALIHQYDRYPELRAALAARFAATNRSTLARAPSLAHATLRKETAGRVRRGGVAHAVCASRHRLSPPHPLLSCPSDAAAVGARREALRGPFFSWAPPSVHG